MKEIAVFYPARTSGFLLWSRHCNTCFTCVILYFPYIGHGPILQKRLKLEKACSLRKATRIMRGRAQVLVLPEGTATQVPWQPASAVLTNRCI